MVATLVSGKAETKQFNVHAGFPTVDFARVRVAG